MNNNCILMTFVKYVYGLISTCLIGVNIPFVTCRFESAYLLLANLKNPVGLVEEWPLKGKEMF